MRNLHRRWTIPALLAFVSTWPCAADHVAYTINGSNQLVAADLATGAFVAIGSPLPYLVTGIGYGSDGRLYSLDSTNMLIHINTSTAAVTTVGNTGIPLLPFQPGSPAVGFAATGSGVLYGMSWDNFLYRFDPATGAGTAIGFTGIPALDLDLVLSGKVGFLKGMAGIRNDLYFSYHPFHLDENGVPGTDIAPAALYRLNLTTGVATKVGDLPPFTWLLGSMDGVLYGEQVQAGPNGPSLALVRIIPNTAACHVVVAGLSMDHFFDGVGAIRWRPWPGWQGQH